MTRPPAAGRPLVLASRSPQRRAILAQIGIAFEVRPAVVDERSSGEPVAVAGENARRKALAVAAQPDLAANARVLGVDTVVALGGVIYGKPASEAHARATLAALGGRTHEVVSALCLAEPAGAVRSAVATTRVRIRALDPGWLDWYLATGEWRDRAGGYAIQGAGAALVLGVEGDYSGVVGLPIVTLLELCPDLHRST